MIKNDSASVARTTIQFRGHPHGPEWIGAGTPGMIHTRRPDFISAHAPFTGWRNGVLIHRSLIAIEGEPGYNTRPQPPEPATTVRVTVNRRSCPSYPGFYAPVPTVPGTRHIINGISPAKA